jgi:peroxiredoxin
MTTNVTAPTKTLLVALTLACASACTSVPSASANVEIGKPAPAFTLPSADGKEVSLESQRGKFVVLEWLNHGCPYVRKHYDSDNMQSLQRKLTEKGVVWLSIISSAPGKQGHSTPAQALADATAKGAKPTAVLLDESGTVGRLYGAATTPHMFVIDPTGALVYMGAIDDQPSFAAESITGAKNFVQQALDEAMASKTVSTPATKPYGCSVKY